jgi:hypothetical protein
VPLNVRSFRGRKKRKEFSFGKLRFFFINLPIGLKPPSPNILAINLPTNPNYVLISFPLL